MMAHSTTENLTTSGAPQVSFVVTAERGGVEIVDAFSHEWRTLCCESTQDSPFYRPEWIAAFLRAFFPQANVLLITARYNGRLILILPLLEEKAFFYGVPLRKLRTPVNSHSCRFDAVRRSGPIGDSALLASWDYLQKLEWWDLLEMSEVPESGTLQALLQAAQANGFPVGQVCGRPSPLVPVPDSLELLKQLPRNARLRGKLRQIRRELAAQGQLRLRRVQQADPAILERFYKLEAAGWKGKEGSAIARNAQTRQFYDEVARSAAHFGYLSLYLLELDDQLLAAHFGLTQGERYFSPKVTYDENSKQWAPGHLIVDEILQDCVSRKITTYDITGPDDEWKMKWTEKTLPKYRLYIFSKGLRGRVAHMLRFRLRPQLAKLIPRKGRGT